MRRPEFTVKINFALSRLRLIFFFIIYGLINIEVNCQSNIEDVHSTLDSADVAFLHADFMIGKEIVNEALLKYNQLKDSVPTQIDARIYNLTAFYYYFVSEIDSARMFLDSSETILLELLTAQPENKGLKSELAKCYNLYGYCAFRLARPLEVIHHVKRAYHLLDNGSVNEELFNEVVHNLGVAYVIAGEYDMGIEYLTLSMNREPLEDIPDGFRTLTALAGAHKSLFQFEKAMKFQKQALEMTLKRFGENHFYTAEVYGGLSTINYLAENDEMAKHYTQKSINIFKGIGREKIPVNIKLYGQLGEINTILRHYDEAIANFQKSIELTDSHSDDFQNLHAESYRGLAAIYWRLGDYEKAYDYIQRTAVSLNYNPGSPSRYKDTRHSQLRHYFSLGLKIVDQLLASGSDLVSMNDLERMFEDAVGFEDYMVTSRISEQSKIHQALIADDIYSLYISHLIKKNELYKALTIAEKNKVRQLRDYLDFIKLEKTLQIPEDQLAKRKELEFKINALEIGIYASDDGLNAQRLDSLRDDLVNLRMEKNDVLKNLQDSFPAYARYLLENQHTGSIKPDLNDSEGILEFYAKDSSYLVFFVTNDTIIVDEILNRLEIDSMIVAYRHLIFDYWLNESNEEQYYSLRNRKMTELSGDLYQRILKSIEKHLPEHLLVVPEANIGLLPFETLIQSDTPCAEDLSTCSYLIRRLNVQYSYSYQLWQQNKKMKGLRPHNYEMALFAPSYVSSSDQPRVSVRAVREGLGELIYNKKEIELIGQISSGRLFKNDLASKNNFTKEAYKYRILHLASHAKSNSNQGEFSYIAFDNTKRSEQDDFKLYANEIFKMDLSSELVVLSACETGLGEHVEGEGLVGLARGFFFAGARSLIVSLWAVNDARTLEFMTSFYRNLKDGNSKSEALRQTKLSFLLNKESADPFYWSPFVIYGDDRPLYFNHNRALSLAGFFLSMLIIMIFLVRGNLTATTLEKCGEEVPISS